MKFLITGGNGFIGHTMVRRLLNQGHSVKVVDIKQIPFRHENLSFVNKSIMDDLSEEMKGCDQIFHFAALLGVVTSDSNPLNTLNVNIDGTVNIFKCAHKANVKNIIYTSSSEVYGEAKEIPLTEDSPKSPVSIYGVSKLTSEMYAHGYNTEYQMDIRPVRLFNVYGPGQGFDWVVPLFIKNILAGNAPIVFGDGSQIRCFTYIEDVIDGLLTVMEKGKAGEAYNIANTEPTTIKQLATILIDISGQDLKPHMKDFGQETREKKREIMVRIPSAQKLNKLGWDVHFPTRLGLQKTFEWYKENLGKEELFYE